MKLLIKTFLIFLISIAFSHAQSPANPCTERTDIHIVVIGSSTAAGAGPSSSDSAWVNRYRKYLQTINTNNQVTNLAVGGTTTYHIMPDWYTAPSGRPSRNTNKNISKAISLGADAVIVNMPSNDAAYNYGVNEQMANFITLFNEGNINNIPVWICTTQPRNFSTSKKAIQTAVRDSIFNYFGMYAIDFWNGCADSNNNILSAYDSGDGVHMNNAGHRILNERVMAEDIPNHVADTLPNSDHILLDVQFDAPSVCGDSNSIINIIISNIGQASASNISVNIAQNDLINGIIKDTTIQLIQPTSVCKADTISFMLNSYNGMDIDLSAFLVNSDVDHTNDSSGNYRFTTLGHPGLSGTNDTICLGESTTLQAFVNSPADTIFWYDADTGGNIIGYGNNFLTSNLTTDQTYYPEAVRGDLFFNNSLFTTASTTINWNGFMFDVVASTTITIDSIQAKLNTTGTQNVVAYYRMGSYEGNENNSSAWNAWGTDTVQVNFAGEFKTLDYSDIVLNANDTLGIYLHMQSSSSRVSYQHASSITNFNNSEIEILSGSGISYNFSTIYSPRNFSGEVFYHYGFNPSGVCNSDRLAIRAIISEPTINIGNDTILDYTASILLNNNMNFSTYLWNNNDTTAQLLVDSTNLSDGVNMLWLTATDRFGCIASDTISITLSNLTFLQSLEETSIEIAPNPTHGTITIKGLENHIFNIALYDLNGEKLIENHDNNNRIVLRGLTSGMYFLVIDTKDKTITKKVIISR
ncbi:MAG: T9SS type A sorting domain-containing protein [Saprospiraceae bacterium]|nr:T9SS type A sorting domain-containing protein [Saprospiraceae bacterium]